MAEGEGSWWERGRSLSRRKGRSLGERRGGLIVDKRQKEAFMAFFFFFSLPFTADRIQTLLQF